ncbi:choice-of-anchor L domain-containing protein [Aureivirga sp. CE67]|uniref:choice-of-anchor L domain-containing protein n=1 Tax=Aureivirga sp. CE67 TaxID=1788983 RepID=UPI0018CAF478|nr:choice-of-anchor L domain-containing protein [Aureivirga sp. CE67]
MKKKLLYLGISMLGISSYAQLNNIDINMGNQSDYTPQQLVEEVFSNDSCVDVEFTYEQSNPDYSNTDIEKSYGFFVRQPESDFPFEKGVVLTSGSAGTDGTSVGGLDWDGDSDIETLTENNSYNATIFEFDFIAPLELDEVRFKYLFASHEFGTYACQYSDAFALIISGPGIDNVNNYDLDADENTPDVELNLGGKNIAVIPGTNIPVNVTNIRSIENPCGGLNEEWFNENESSTKYNGETLPMEATIDVIPGETYHVKMVIADALDSSFDSAIFLDAQSFILSDFYLENQQDEILIEESEGESSVVLEDYTDLVDANYFCMAEAKLNNAEFTMTQTPPAGTVITEDTTVTIEVSDNILNRTHTTSFELKIVPEGSLNLNEESFSGLSFYPNPTNGVIYINNFEKINSIKAFNYNGAQVYNQIITNSVVDFSNLNSGIYFLEMEMKDGTTIREKLIIE